MTPISKFFLCFFCFFCRAGFGQTLGGASAYNFLKLPAVPLLTAAGGVNASSTSKDVSLSTANPALLQPELSTQINTSFNAFLGGIKSYALTGAYHSERFNTTFGGHVYFVDYGSIPQTDAAGAVSGEFRPTEFVVQASAARKYLEKWTYAGTLKFIRSGYGQYSSSAMAVDVGLLYRDSAAGFTAGLVAKNMGAQLKSFTGVAEDLPFDLQLGISKRLTKAPFGFSFTAHHLHRFNLSYDDKTFNADNGFSSPSSVDKIFNHIVATAHVYIGQNLEAMVGYNHLRRRELSIPDAGNGLAGFSTGLQILFSKLHVQYAYSSYQRGVGYHQIGITAQMNQLVGLGK